MLHHDHHRRFFDYHAPDWDNVDLITKQQRIREVFERYAPEIRSPVLDLGSGTGIMVPVLLEQKGQSGMVIEFDLSLGMLNQAAAKIKDSGDVVCLQGDAHELPFTDRQIATVICFESFPHFRHPPSVLQELHRVLARDGNLLILHLMGHERLNAYHRRVGDVVLHDHLPSLAGMKNILDLYGFRTRQVEEYDDLYLVEALKIY